MSAPPECNICRSVAIEPMYRSAGHASLTTMNRLYDQPTEVFFCTACGHLQTTEIVDIEDYYAHQYAILAESNEEDQLYKIVNGQPIFQVEHRVCTLLRSVSVPAGARVLDFGCAKGAVAKRLQQERPDVTPFLFDVTERYLPFWSTFAHSRQWSTGNLRSEWTGTLDVVCSFYVLEHVADPLATVTQMASLLKPGGPLYFMVPNLLANAADMIVADHLQHYSGSSLLRLLTDAGLDRIVVDDQSHDAAYIAMASKPPASSAPGTASKMSATCQRTPQIQPDELRIRYAAIARLWSGAADRIRDFEGKHASAAMACIYGAGFYGNFIASCLANPSVVSCFVDQNPFIRTRLLQGKPIVAPRDLADDVALMYVGLNPATARTVIGDMDCWSSRSFESFYL